MASVVALGCTSTNNSPFTPAQVSVDPTKMMNALSTSDQTTLCAQLTQSLTTSFGSRDVDCQFGSHGGENPPGSSACENQYNNCIAQTPASSSVSACTDNNSDMFMCAITVAQFTACFNATNEYLLRTSESTPVCGDPPNPTPQPTADEMAACVSATCDYIWFD